MDLFVGAPAPNDDEKVVVSFDLGFRNLGVWVGSYDLNEPPIPRGLPFRFRYWQVMDLGPAVTTSRLAVDRMVPLFEATPVMWQGVSECLIEMQDPGKRLDVAELMRRQQFEEFGRAIHCYYRMKNIPVTYISSANKLKLLDIEWPEKTLTRADRKTTAVSHTTRLWNIGSKANSPNSVKSLQQPFHYFWSLSQKHDAADAFLQAAYHLRREMTKEAGLLAADGRTILKRKLQDAERQRDNLFTQLHELELELEKQSRDNEIE